MERRWGFGAGLAVLLTACGDAPVTGSEGLPGPPSEATTSAHPPADESSGTSEDTGPVEPPPVLDGGSDSGSSSSGGGSETGDPLPPGPHFVDVTAEAGLVFDPGDLHPPPFCLLDDINEPADGDYCTPERFLGAVAVADFDLDDWPDLFITRKNGPGMLMRNRGDGTFEDVTEARGLVQDHITGGAAWLDVEGDGDLDLMLTGFGTLRHFLYINDGTGSFVEAALSHGAAVQTDFVHVGTGIGVGDYDLDGYLDVFVADWRAALLLGVQVDHNRLLHNLGAQAPGHFEDVTKAMEIDMQESSQWTASGPGAFGFAPAFVDLDGDHWPELALAADYASSRLYWNDGGIFTNGTVESGVYNNAHGMGSAFGDYDGDGDLDWFISAIWSPGGPEGNRLYRNEGDRTFVEQTDQKGVREGGWGWGAAFFDADHDGDEDLALTSGWPSSNYQNDPVRLWDNTGPGVWPERALELGIDFVNGRGLVPFDYDRDGDLDLLVHTNTEPPGLFRNDGAHGAWLQVRAVGLAGNPRSIGAEVRVQAVAGGPWQVRHIGVGSHFFGQQDAMAHFGLGAGEQPIHRVEVYWPASGQLAQLDDVARDQVLVVHE